MPLFPRRLIAACFFLPLALSIEAAPTGFLEGRLKIFSLKEVELAGATPSKMTAGNYADYPVVILSGDGKREIASATPDANGSYRVELPPGDYILDVQDRVRRHIRALPQSFTVASGQTAHVDINIDTGIR